LLSLLEQVRTTEEVAYLVGYSVDTIRWELIRLHHLDLVAPIGVRHVRLGERTPRKALSYSDNLLWDVTDHMRFHDQTIPGCRGCKVRTLAPAFAKVGLVE